MALTSSDRPGLPPTTAGDFAAPGAVGMTQPPREDEPPPLAFARSTLKSGVDSHCFCLPSVGGAVCAKKVVGILFVSHHPGRTRWHMCTIPPLKNEAPHHGHFRPLPSSVYGFLTRPRPTLRYREHHENCLRVRPMPPTNQHFRADGDRFDFTAQSRE